MSETGPLHRTGDGPAIVLVHGVGLDHTMWHAVTPLLAVDHEVITYDLLGHGQSADEPGERALDDFVDQLCGVLDVVAGASPTSTAVDVVGLSLGALISLYAAAREPARIRSVVLANMVYGRTAAQQAAVNDRLALAERTGLSAIADLAIDRWFTPEWQAANPEQRDAVHQRLATTDPGGYLKAYRVFATTNAHGAQVAADVTIPALALTGALDPGSTPAMTERLGADLQRGTATVLDGLHHLPAIEDPNQFVAALRLFHATAFPPATSTPDQPLRANP